MPLWSGHWWCHILMQVVYTMPLERLRFCSSLDNSRCRRGSYRSQRQYCWVGRSCQHRLSIQTTVTSGIVYDASFDGGCSPQYWRVWLYGVEIVPLSGPMVTSYRLPIISIRLSLTVLTVLRLVEDGQKELVWKRQHCAQKCISRPKIQKQPKSLQWLIRQMPLFASVNRNSVGFIASQYLICNC